MMKVKVILTGLRACGKSHLAGYIREAVDRQRNEAHQQIALEIDEHREELKFFSKIEVKRQYERLEVHPLPNPPGMYPIGYGKTIEEAMGNFLIAYQKQLGVEVVVHPTATADEINRRREALKQR